MLRKWEWIKEQCLKRGLTEPAKVAEEIDVILLENYDAEHTPKWIASYLNTNMEAAVVSYDVLVGIAMDTRYCIACIANERNCRECRFAKLCGTCGDQDSLYSRFLKEVDKAWPHEVQKLIRRDAIENINGRIE